MQDGIEQKVKRRTDRLISAGGGLLARLTANPIGDSELPTDISNWISGATSELLEVMPEEASDYDKLVEIRGQYARSERILLPSAGDDIRIVLKNLSIARDCIMASEKADIKDIPPQKLAAMAYDRLRQYVDYVKTDIVALLVGKEDGRTRRTALLHMYGRMYMWAQSMVKLDAIEDCLALAGCVRAILELHIDLNLMASNVIPDDVEKYFSFQDVEKWKKARSIVSNRARFGDAKPGDTTAVDEYLKQPGNEEVNIKALRKRLWGVDRNEKPRNPGHWTDKSLIDRAVLLKEDLRIVEIFRSSYHYCNWLVHSMYSDITKHANTVHLFNSHLYRLATDMFVTSTKLVNDTVAGVPREDLESRFGEIQAQATKAFFGELVKAGHNKGK